MAGDNQRAHERHDINEGKFVTLAGSPVLVQDISWGGLKFFAIAPCEATATVAADGGAIRVEFNVVGCTDSSATAVDPAYPFLVRGQFLAKPDDPSIEALMDFVLD